MAPPDSDPLHNLAFNAEGGGTDVIIAGKDGAAVGGKRPITLLPLSLQGLPCAAPAVARKAVV